MSENNTEGAKPNRPRRFAEARLLASAAAASLEECKMCWDFFDEELPGDTMDILKQWASEGASVEKIMADIEDKMPPQLLEMPEIGRYGLVLCVEYAVRTSAG